jgi:hypothetical protein
MRPILVTSEFRPNHFVPLVRLKKVREEVVSISDTSVMNEGNECVSESFSNENEYECDNKSVNENEFL